MKEETLKQFTQFLTVRNRDYRAVNVERGNVSSEIKYIKQLLSDGTVPSDAAAVRIDIGDELHERLERYEERLDELCDMHNDKKQLAKRFVPRFYTIVDGVWAQLKTQSEAYKIIDEANGYGNDGEPLWKLCKDCEEEKPLTEFHKHTTTKDRLMNKCKVCSQEISSTARANKKRRLKERQEIEDSISKTTKCQLV